MEIVNEQWPVDRFNIHLIIALGNGVGLSEILEEIVHPETMSKQDIRTIIKMDADSDEVNEIFQRIFDDIRSYKIPTYHQDLYESITYTWAYLDDAVATYGMPEDMSFASLAELTFAYALDEVLSTLEPIIISAIKETKGVNIGHATYEQ